MTATTADAAALEPRVMTSDQAAKYLHVYRRTIYHYIREGKLRASRLVGGYRIHREDVELLLRATRTRLDIALREYGADEVEGFLRRDAIDEAAATIAKVEDALARTGGRPEC
jgi:excisionase family DNA binding protein